MKFSDEGIIISLKKYGENSLIAKVFSKEHGLYSAFVRSVKSAKNRSIFQIGNLITFEFYAKMEDNLGSFSSFDLQKSYLMKVLFEKLKLSAINSIFSVINDSFLERESHQFLFEKLNNFLKKISTSDVTNEEFLKDYIMLEMQILQDLGYGLDFSSCAGGGETTHLAFISPKSARAVSFEKGQPYEDKLLKLPKFLLDESREANSDEILQGFKLTGFFLEKFLLKEKSLGKDHEKQFLLRNELIKNAFNA